MSLTARDLIHREVLVVEPKLPLADLEEAFLEQRVGGFPVVENGRLVGLVSRSDVVRQLCVERSNAERLSDYYQDVSGFQEEPPESLSALADRVGARIDTLCVRDVMVHALVTVRPDTPLREVARTLVDHGIHRVLVTEDERLVGIVSSLDLARLFAEDRVEPL